MLASRLPTTVAWKLTQVGMQIAAKTNSTLGNQPRGPNGSSIQRLNG